MKNLPVLVLSGFLYTSISLAAASYTELREALVQEIQLMVRETSDYTGRLSFNENVITAIRKVPRHEFIPDELKPFAYLNQALPIGSEQTISQPYIVALMTELAEIEKNDIVLEIGTGSGYQAAVLAELSAKVYSVEIIEHLGKTAAQTLKRLRYGNVSVKIGDGYEGWQEYAPFDVILVTAAPEEVPAPLLQQLRPGGRMVIPLGKQSSSQSLQVIEKDEQGRFSRRDILPVGFVPLTRE